MRKGFTMVELMVGMTIMGMLIVGALTVFSSSMKSFYQTQTDIVMTSENTLGMQRVSTLLKSAYSMSVNDAGTTVTYTLPAISTVTDSVTLEKEYLDPLQSDGIQRSFSIVNGQLIDDVEDRVLIENIVMIDPMEDSSQYNQTYKPFSLTTIGSRRALTINFITQDQVLGKPQYVRMKTTVIIRNSL